MKVRKSLGKIMDEAWFRGEEIVVEKAGKPYVVILPAKKYLAIKDFGWDTIISYLNEYKDMNRDMTDEEVETFVADAIREVRKHK